MRLFNSRLDSTPRTKRFVLFAAMFAMSAVFVCSSCAAQAPATSNETIPVEQVRPGMQGYAYTIFAGDQVEKFALEVLGVMPNFLGPKQ